MMMALKMALRSINGNKMRAALTMLGIIIGVMALVVLVSIVNGATSSITDAVSGLGSSQLTVTVSDDKGSPVRLADLDEWTEKESAIGRIAPYATDSVTAKGSNGNADATIYGATSDYLEVEGLQLSMGRWLKSTDVSNTSLVCVMDESTAEDLIGYADCVGEVISLDGMKYTVVGILEDDDESLTAAFSSGSTIYIPYTSLVKLSDTTKNEVTTFYVSAAEGSDLEAAEAAMEELLLDRFAEDDEAFSISSQDALEDTMSSITSMLEILLGGIAAISLVVGGIGIMNIMLVTVTERTREIGIRKAIGASRSSILTQFLMEAVVLCMIGCALGIFISWSILQLVTTVVSSLSMTFSLEGNVVMLSVAFCFVIGVVFGLYPANKAAKMKPIDALHYGG